MKNKPASLILFSLLLPAFFLQSLSGRCMPQHNKARNEHNRAADLIESYHQTGDTMLLQKAILLATDQSVKGESYRQLGLYYHDIFENNTSVEYFQKALDLFALSRDSVGLMKANLNLGVVYYMLAEIPLSLIYTERSADIARKMNDKVALSIITRNLGSIYSHFDDSLEKAVLFYRESYQLSALLGDTLGILASINNLGVTYLKKNQYRLALDSFFEALKLAEKHQSDSDICRINTNIASIYLNLGDSGKALNYLMESEQICEGKDLVLSARRLGLLAEAYAATGRYHDAFEALKHFNALNDSIYDMERIMAINELAEKYETEKKEQQIQLLEKDIIIQKEIAKRELDKRKAMLTATLLVAFFSVFLIIVYLEKRNINRRLAVLNIQLKKSETQLKELNQSKDKFFGILSHDLRNPLAAFEKLSSSLIGQPFEKQKETAIEMAENSKLLGSLLNNLLIWSKAEQGLLSIKPQALLLHQIADASLALFKTQANEKNIALINHSDPYLMVFADRESLHTIFRNIIGNAIKFTLRGSVTITSEAVNDLAHITVSDTGIGMNNQQVERLFALSSSHQAGLGLILCKELAQRNNAAITLSSQPDKGTNVLITIPIFRTHEDSLS